MMIALVPFLFAIVGVLIFAFSSTAKPIGLYMFATSWLVVMYVLSEHTIRLLR